MAIPVPNGERTFSDPNGHPISGGLVYTYVPGTTDPVPTYQDEQLTVANPNPMTLDQAGRAVMWYPGLIRQIVYDMFGNLQWDQETGFSLDNYQGDLNVSGNLTVGGSSTFNGPVTDNSSLTVAGPTNLDGGANIAGGANISGGANVSGGLNTDGLNDSGDATIGGTLTVNGATNANGGLNTTSLNDSGDANIGGNLTVGGNGQIDGNLNVGGTITGGSMGGSEGSLFPPGTGGDYVTSMQLLWGSYTNQTPPSETQVDPSPFHQPYGLLAHWYLIVTTAQGKQFTMTLSPSDYPTVPVDASSFVAPQYPPNSYIQWGVFPPDQSGASQWITEIMPDGSWINWTDNGSGGVNWSPLNSGAAGQPNDNPNGPMGTGNPAYQPWPQTLLVPPAVI